MTRVVFCVLLILVSTAPGSLGNRIVGGDEVTPHSRPYQVAIMNMLHMHFCGGTLVHEQWIISAAHCGGSSYIFAGLGYHSLTDTDKPNMQFAKGKWIIHPGYTRGFDMDDDIALIKLDKPATLNSDVQPIKINSSPPSEGTDLLISGWGNTDPFGYNKPDKLREVVVQANSHQYCKMKFGDYVTDNMFCASVFGGGKGSCQGDSGGPVVSNFAQGVHQDGVLLNGIVSWGQGCASAGYPGVYVKVSNYCGWLETVTSGDVKCA